MTVILAMIANKSTEVINTIVAENDSFTMDGYFFVPVNGKQCEIGMFYNKIDGLFYYDEGFSLTSNPIEDPSQVPLDGES